MTGQLCFSRFVANSNYYKHIAVKARIFKMQVKGCRRPCVEVRHAACEFPSILFHQSAAG